jgi:hypothetical protein
MNLAVSNGVHFQQRSYSGSVPASVPGVVMRADMARVIVERPRLKGHAWNKPKGYQRRLQRYGEDGPPAREGIRDRWQGGTKELNEHLGPLRRYLDSQVGRPWDLVFSEICAHINRNSAVQDHVRDHVEDYVTRHVILIDGVPYNGEGGSWNYGKPLHEMPYRPWYVCPRTGLLRRVKVAGRKRRQPTKSESPPKYIRVSDTLQCRFFGNAWHLVTLQPLPERNRGRLGRDVDVLLNRPVVDITPGLARQEYGAEVYAVRSRPLARRELKQYPIPTRWWTPGRPS